MNKSSSTKAILYQIANYIRQGLTIAMEMHRYQKIYLSGGGHQQVVEIKQIHKQRVWRDKFYQLRRSGYLKTKKMGNKLIITLTNKGQRLNLLQQIKQAPKCSAGFSTLVIFDIPEQTAKARRELRQFLQAAGFKQLQRSVWLHSCYIVKELKQFLNERKLTEWVRVFQGEIVK